ncbi:hypothetical protein LQW54_001184 [Pestalotiopsis sp. IQ-011]
MDTDVLQNIDLFPVTNTKGIDSLLDNSSTLRQLSSISFWDNFDNATTINDQDNKAAQTQTTTVELAKTSPKKSPKPVRKSLKRAHTPDHKRSKLSQDSALDCCDYWLRFDSDDDSLERLGDFDNQASTDRRFSFQQPTRLGRVGGTGSFNLDFSSRTDDWLEDSALEHALSSEEDSFSMALDDDFAQRDVAQTQDVAPERLYSTPLSWDAPQPGVGTESYFNVNPAFNDPERQRLLAIAMGSGLTQLPAEPRNSAMDFTFDMQASPSATSDTTSNPPEPKHRRTSFAITSSAKTSRSNSRSGLITPNELNEPSAKKEKPRNSDRAAHNDIERKYRTNLKDRIADLREAIPSLRSIPEDFDDDGSPVPVSRAPKVSKGTILTKATEYIHQLERRNRSMSHKNEELLRRLQAFEQLLGATPAPATWQPQGYGAAVFNPAARFSA